MNFEDSCKTSIGLAQNSSVISDEVFKKMLENCFAILTGKEEIHSIMGLCQSKPDVLKEFYAALLCVSAEFARRRSSTEDILRFLNTDCGLPLKKSNLFTEYFDKNKLALETSLLNITGALPHVTDVKWKIDYIVKSNTMDSSEGPIFRINLISEKFDTESQHKKLENIMFNCTSQELQDLVYKLKDAVRHCSSVTQRLL
ncbi:COMM domain-containing protein 3 [Leptinotarsa decemlineata]|uniref:COMM domain-containing protein 3 n=1 Tax=Leptinotarsa decemlineata TaxID=7539 RepID=UPI003D309EA1